MQSGSKGMQGVFYMCVCERERERKREGAFRCSGAQWFSQSCLVWGKLQSRLHFWCWPFVFPRKEECSHGSKRLRKKWEAGSVASPGGSGGMLCVLIVPPGNISTTVPGLALSPPGSPISILPSVSKSCLWPSTPSLWVFSFLMMLLGEISRNYLIEGRNFISNKRMDW